jgi:hypothetical protein
VPGSGPAYGFAIDRHNTRQRGIDQDILDPGREKLPELNRIEQGKQPVEGFV